MLKAWSEIEVEDNKFVRDAFTDEAHSKFPGGIHFLVVSSTYVETQRVVRGVVAKGWKSDQFCALASPANTSYVNATASLLQCVIEAVSPLPVKNHHWIIKGIAGLEVRVGFPNSHKLIPFETTKVC